MSVLTSFFARHRWLIPCSLLALFLVGISLPFLGLMPVHAAKAPTIVAQAQMFTSGANSIQIATLSLWYDPQTQTNYASFEPRILPVGSTVDLAVYRLPGPDGNDLFVPIRLSVIQAITFTPRVFSPHNLVLAVVVIHFANQSGTFIQATRAV